MILVETDGDFVGAELGGFTDGTRGFGGGTDTDGAVIGARLGRIVGTVEGEMLGCCDGIEVGRMLGACVGVRVVGLAVGSVPGPET